MYNNTLSATSYENEEEKKDNFSSTSSAFMDVQQKGGAYSATSSEKDVNKLISMLTSESSTENLNAASETSTVSLENQLRDILKQEGGGKKKSNKQKGGSNLNAEEVKKFFMNLKSEGVNVDVKLNNKSMSDFFGMVDATSTDIGAVQEFSSTSENVVNEMEGGAKKSKKKNSKKGKKEESEMEMESMMGSEPGEIESMIEYDSQPTSTWVTRSVDDKRSLAFTNVECRAIGDGNTLVGYASMFDAPSHDLGGFTEYVARGAFTKTLKDGADVRLLIDHEGAPLARTKSNTMRLVEDERGLRVEADLDPANPRAAEIISAFLLAPGNISQHVSMCHNMPNMHQYISVCLNQHKGSPETRKGAACGPEIERGWGDFLKTRYLK
jgi:HK97 family phage prohead protease